MPILGITGGIATGKSSFASLLSREIPATLFDADRSAKDLLHNHKVVQQRVRGEFGDAVFTPEGDVDRVRLRGIVFGNEERRRALEQILHPVIREQWLSLAEKARTSGEWLAIDIPLLFETGAEPQFDRIVVVACNASTQMNRLLNIRNLDPDMAGKIIAAQMDLNVKISKADYLIWNDGSHAMLAEQATLLADLLKQRHG